MKKIFTALLIALAGLTSAFTAVAGDIPEITQVRGHRYVVNDGVITQYDQNGNPVEQLVLGGSIRGIAWGPDGYLYAVINVLSPELPHVRVMEGDGSVVRTHLFTGAISGNIAYGGIDFDYRRGLFYVGTGAGTYRFEIGGGAGTQINATSAYNLSVAPNGEITAINGNFVFRMNLQGQEIGRTTQLTQGGSPPPINNRIYDGRGVLYDPEADLTYVSMLGVSSAFYQILILDGMGPELLHSTTFTYAHDLAQELNGNILVGSRTQAPVWYDPALGLLGQVNGSEGLFVAVWPATAYIHAGSFED